MPPTSQSAQIAEPKKIETANPQPRPEPQPRTRPFRIKITGQIPF